MPDELKSQIKSMIVERLFLKIEPDAVPEDENLMDALGIDSVNLFEIIVGLEDDFDIALEEDDFDIATFSTVNNIANFVEQKRQG